MVVIPHQNSLLYKTFYAVSAIHRKPLLHKSQIVKVGTNGSSFGIRFRGLANGKAAPNEPTLLIICPVN
jgi:hypothetical protein